MGNLTIATIFIVLVNVLMWFSGIAMLDVNPGGSVCYSPEGSIIGESIEGSGDGAILNNDALSQLPSGEGVVETGDSGVVFTINTTTLTGRTSGAGANEFNFGATLSLTLDAIVSAINAAETGVITCHKVGTTMIVFEVDVTGTPWLWLRRSPRTSIQYT